MEAYTSTLGPITETDSSVRILLLSPGSLLVIIYPENCRHSKFSYIPRFEGARPNPFPIILRSILYGFPAR